MLVKNCVNLCRRSRRTVSSHELMADRILIIDDHQLFLDGMFHLLTNRGYEAVDVANSVAEAIAYLESGAQYQIAILDLNLGGEDGLSFLNHVREHRYILPTVVVSAISNVQEILKCLKLGATGFIPKDADADRFMSAFEQILDGQIYLPTFIWNQLSTYPRYQEAESVANLSLTPELNERQQEVLQLVGLGLPNREIAERLGVRETTVKYHITKLFKLFDVESRTALIKAGEEQGAIALVRNSGESLLDGST